MKLTRIAGRDALAQWQDWQQAARRYSSVQARWRAPLRKLNEAAAH